MERLSFIKHIAKARCQEKMDLNIATKTALDLAWKLETSLKTKKQKKNVVAQTEQIKSPTIQTSRCLCYNVPSQQKTMSLLSCKKTAVGSLRHKCADRPPTSRPQSEQASGSAECLGRLYSARPNKVSRTDLKYGPHRY